LATISPNSEAKRIKIPLADSLCRKSRSGLITRFISQGITLFRNFALN
jgi:hypothetical protein